MAAGAGVTAAPVRTGPGGAAVVAAPVAGVPAHALAAGRRAASAASLPGSAAPAGSPALTTVAPRLSGMAAEGGLTSDGHAPCARHGRACRRSQRARVGGDPADRERQRGREAGEDSASIHDVDPLPHQLHFITDCHPVTGFQRQGRARATARPGGARTTPAGRVPMAPGACGQTGAGRPTVARAWRTRYSTRRGTPSWRWGSGGRR